MMKGPSLSPMNPKPTFKRQAPNQSPNLFKAASLKPLKPLNPETPNPKNRNPKAVHPAASVLRGRPMCVTTDCQVMLRLPLKVLTGYCNGMVFQVS